MEKVVRQFRSHQEAEEADIEYYRSLTPEQRLEILYTLVEQSLDPNDPNARRLQKVVRKVPLEED